MKTGALPQRSLSVKGGSNKGIQHISPSSKIGRKKKGKEYLQVRKEGGEGLRFYGAVLKERGEFLAHSTLEERRKKTSRGLQEYEKSLRILVIPGRREKEKARLNGEKVKRRRREKGERKPSLGPLSIRKKLQRRYQTV